MVEELFDSQGMLKSERELFSESMDQVVTRLQQRPVEWISVDYTGTTLASTPDQHFLPNEVIGDLVRRIHFLLANRFLNQDPHVRLVTPVRDFNTVLINRLQSIIVENFTSLLYKALLTYRFDYTSKRLDTCLKG